MVELFMTFDKIAPQWSDRLRNFPPSLLSAHNISWGLQIVLANTCVIGEAHGYSGDYIEECVQCRQLGHEFVRSYFARSLGRMQATIGLFTSHWNARHLKRDKPVLLEHPQQDHVIST